MSGQSNEFAGPCLHSCPRQPHVKGARALALGVETFDPPPREGLSTEAQALLGICPPPLGDLPP